MISRIWKHAVVWALIILTCHLAPFSFACDIPKIENLGPTLNQDKILFTLLGNPKEIQSISIVIHHPRTQQAVEVEMTHDGGVGWRARIENTRDVVNYQYKVTDRTGNTKYISDPFAYHVTNSHISIFDPKLTPRDHRPSWPSTAQVIYELNLRDAVKGTDPNIGNFADRLIGHPEFANLVRNFDAIELLPVQHHKEFGFQNYHHYGGYMPLNFGATHYDYFSPRQFKKLLDFVQHKLNTRVILDLVFNHTAEGNSRGTTVNFKALGAGDFYRMTPTGNFYNGSGCGNEFRTESAMGQLVLLSMVRRWLLFYGVDGIRFDLAALIDANNMRRIRDMMRVHNRIIMGEPWAAEYQRSQWEWIDGVGSWNDFYRESVRHYVNHPTTRNIVKNLISGHGPHQGHIRNALLDQTIYIESHDGPTARYVFGDDIQKTKLANLILMVSQGNVLIGPGQPFALNHAKLDNTPVDIYAPSAEGLAFFRDFFQPLVEFRRSHANHFSHKTLISETVQWFTKENSPTFGFRLKSTDYIDPDLFIVINPRQYSEKIELPSGHWHVLYDGFSWTAKDTIVEGSQTIVAPPQTAVICRQR